MDKYTELYNKFPRINRSSDIINGHLFFYYKDKEGSEIMGSELFSFDEDDEENIQKLKSIMTKPDFVRVVGKY